MVLRTEGFRVKNIGFVCHDCQRNGVVAEAPILKVVDPSPMFSIPAPVTANDHPIPSLLSKEERIERWQKIPEAELSSWPLKRGRLSASALGAFAKCPELFRLRYIEGRYSADNGRTIAGNAVHSAVDVAARYKVAHGEDILPKVAGEVAADAFKQHAENANVIVWGGNPGDFKDRAVVVAEWWASRISPIITPVESDTPFVVSIPGVPVPVIGFIDLTTDRAMIDVKIGKGAQQKINPEWRVQGLVYLRAKPLPMAWHSLSWPLKDGTVNYHTPADSGAGLVLDNTPGQYDLAGRMIRSYVEGILSYAETFGPDDPWPGNVTHTYACSTCDFREHDCAWWQTSINEWWA